MTNPNAVTVRDPMDTSAVDPQVAAAMRIKSQLETVKSVLAPDLNDQELQLFAMVAQRLELDPFIRQIHAIKRNSRQGPRLTFQTGIDGFRASAEDTGEYRGSDEPTFGKWIPAQGNTPAHPESATVVVHRQYANGEWLHQPATVYWDEFYPGNDDPGSFMWKKMPRNQLAKCAEAAAFRKAFPKRFAGVYAPEEMEQDRDVIDVTPQGTARTARERVAERRRAIEARAPDESSGDGGPASSESPAGDPSPAAGGAPHEVGGADVGSVRSPDDPKGAAAPADLATEAQRCGQEPPRDNALRLTDACIREPGHRGPHASQQGSWPA